jgi:hypothetical protein
MLLLMTMMVLLMMTMMLLMTMMVLLLMMMLLLLMMVRTNLMVCVEVQTLRNCQLLASSHNFHYFFYRHFLLPVGAIPLHFEANKFLYSTTLQNLERSSQDHPSLPLLSIKIDG